MQPDPEFLRPVRAKANLSLELEWLSPLQIFSLKGAGQHITYVFPYEQHYGMAKYLAMSNIKDPRHAALGETRDHLAERLVAERDRRSAGWRDFLGGALSRVHPRKAKPDRTWAGEMARDIAARSLPTSFVSGRRANAKSWLKGYCRALEAV